MFARQLAYVLGVTQPICANPRVVQKTPLQTAVARLTLHPCFGDRIANTSAARTTPTGRSSKRSAPLADRVTSSSRLGKLDQTEAHSARDWFDLDHLLNGTTTPAPQRSLGQPPPPPPAPLWRTIDVRGVRVERVRQFGRVYLALALWRRLRLHELLCNLLPPGEEEIGWDAVACVLTLARFCAPPSERGVAERGYADTALEDLLGVPAEKINDARLKQHFGLASADDEGLRQALGVDFRFVDAPRAGMEVDPVWGFRLIRIQHESGAYHEIVEWPLADADAETLRRWPMPSPDDYDYSVVSKLCARWQEYGLSAGSPGFGDMINFTGRLRTREQVLVDFATDNAAALGFIDRRQEVELEILRRTIRAGGGGITFLWIGEDLGTQRGPTISLEMFRRHFRPRMQRYVDLAREFALPVMIHSCGSSSWAFDDFAAMGIAAVDTLQPEAKDMAPAYLKTRYGDRLAFHGMISTAGALAYGTPADVTANVGETLATMMPGGGYALAPTHQIQDNSPTANVLAMYETARRDGAYRPSV